MKRLNIIGCGNVGKTLGRLWHQRGVFEIHDILNRTAESACRAVDFIGAGRGIFTHADMRPADQASRLSGLTPRPWLQLLFMLNAQHRPSSHITATSRFLAASNTYRSMTCVPWSAPSTAGQPACSWSQSREKEACAR